MTYESMSEMATLRQRLAWAEGELRRIEIESATAAIARRDEIAREESERAETERQAAEAAALEQHRRSAWYNHRLDRAIAAGDQSLADFISAGGPEHHMARAPSGWPPGSDPEQYRRVLLNPPVESVGG
jgi:hypothetical protein